MVPLGNAGAMVIGTVLNGIGSMLSNAQNNRYNQQQQAKQNAWNAKQQNLANMYNSASAQKARLMAAGFSDAGAISALSGASPVQAQAAQSAPYTPSQLDLSQMGNAGATMSSTIAQQNQFDANLAFQKQQWTDAHQRNMIDYLQAIEDYQHSKRLHPLVITHQTAINSNLDAATQEKILQTQLLYLTLLSDPKVQSIETDGKIVIDQEGMKAARDAALAELKAHYVAMGLSEKQAQFKVDHINQFNQAELDKATGEAKSSLATGKINEAKSEALVPLLNKYPWLIGVEFGNTVGLMSVMLESPENFEKLGSSFADVVTSFGKGFGESIGKKAAKSFQFSEPKEIGGLSRWKARSRFKDVNYAMKLSDVKSIDAFARKYKELHPKLDFETCKEHVLWVQTHLDELKEAYGYED